MNRRSPDLSAAHAVLQRHVDAGLLPGASAAVLVGGEIVDTFCCGFADLERREPLHREHIHRAFSNSKLVSAALVLKLADKGHFGLDDPVREWIPELGRLRVLRAGARSLDDTEPMRSDITIAHLLNHRAGFSHGVFDPERPIYRAYQSNGVRQPQVPLAEVPQRLAQLPLLFQPGHGWEYALGADVAARLVEIVTGRPYGEALREHLLEPLAMRDTGFVLDREQAPRLVALYGGAHARWTEPGLLRLDDVPWPGAYRQPVARQSAAGGLFTTLPDMVKLLQALWPGRGHLLRDRTLARALADSLPAEHCVQFGWSGPIRSLGYGLLGAVARRASSMQPDATAGEVQWGGLAGTHWWIAPALGVGGAVMTQRFMGFWHPFWFEYKRSVNVAVQAAAS